MQQPPYRNTRPYGVQLLDDLHNHFPAILYDPVRFQTVPDLLFYIQNCTRSQFDLFSAGQRLYNASTRPPQQRPVTPPPPTPFRSRPRRGGGASNRTHGFHPSPAPRTYDPYAHDPFNFHGPPPQLSQPIIVQDDIYITTTTTDLSGNNSTRRINLGRGADAPGVGNSLFNLADTFLSLNGDGIGRAGTERSRDDEGFSFNLLNAFTEALEGRSHERIRPNPHVNINLFDPVVVYPTEDQIAAATIIKNMESDDAICAICQDEIEQGSTARCIHHCNHSFHVTCIDTWFQRDVHCPVCRYDIRDWRGRAQVSTPVPDPFPGVE